MPEVNGYRFVNPDEVEPTETQVAQARDFLGTTNLPYADEANFNEGVDRVSTMIAASELTLENAREGSRHAEDMDANEKRLIVLARKLKDGVAITLHCMEDTAAQLLIDGHMGYVGRN